MDATPIVQIPDSAYHPPRVPTAQTFPSKHTYSHANYQQTPRPTDTTCKYSHCPSRRQYDSQPIAGHAANASHGKMFINSYSRKQPFQIPPIYPHVLRVSQMNSFLSCYAHLLMPAWLNLDFRIVECHVSPNLTHMSMHNNQSLPWDLMNHLVMSTPWIDPCPVLQ